MRFTTRDRRIMRFIEDFGAANTRQLHTLFFHGVSLRSCQRALARLAAAHALQRCRSYVCEDYLYYVGKAPVQAAHALLRVDAYIGLKAAYRLVDFVPEFTLGRLRADAYFEVWDAGKVTPYFLEVQRSKGFDQSKYDALYASYEWRERWPEFPQVVVLAGRPVRLRHSNVRFTVLDIDRPKWETGVRPTKTETPVTAYRERMGIPKGTFQL